MNFFKKIWNYILGNEEENLDVSLKPTRRYIKDVKPEDNIMIEWSKIKGRYGNVKCLNNDPETKKIFLEVSWNNNVENNVPEKEQFILNYDAEELKNFHLLNFQPTKEELTIESNFDIATLQKHLNIALENEEFEKVYKIQKQLDKIFYKK